MWIHSQVAERMCQVLLAATLNQAVKEAAMQTPSQEQGGMCPVPLWTSTQVCTVYGDNHTKLANCGSTVLTDWVQLKSIMH